MKYKNMLIKMAIVLSIIGLLVALYIEPLLIVLLPFALIYFAMGISICLIPFFVLMALGKYLFKK